MLVRNIQKAGLFSEIRRVIQKVLRVLNPLVPRVAQKQHNFGRSLLCKFVSILNVFFTQVMIKDYILQKQVENCEMG
jgi:hypothetical protein